MGNIFKSAAPAPGDMELINRLAKRELAEDEVYIFSILLCDNEIDRDFERFSDDTLEALAPMFLGTTGLFDHCWSASGQTARIYRTSVESDGSFTSDGRIYRFLRAWAYMLRQGNNQLIEEIEAGIKKEVSVGCSVENTLCSICGKDISTCGHRKGETYQTDNGSALCHGVLTGARDAYEWSFVAVPAQPAAGIIKHYKKEGEGEMTLKELAERDPGSALAAELRRLEADAAAGRTHTESLRHEVRRMLGISLPGVKTGFVDMLSPEELNSFSLSLQKQLAEKYPCTPQFSPAAQAGDDAGYLI